MLDGFHSILQVVKVILKGWLSPSPRLHSGWPWASESGWAQCTLTPEPRPLVVPPGALCHLAPRTHPLSFPGVMKAEPLFFKRSSSDPSSFGSWTPWCPENSILCGPRFVSSSCPTTLKTAVQTQCQHRCPFFLGGLSRGWCAGDGMGGGLGLCWPCLHSACPQPPKAMLS